MKLFQSNYSIVDKFSVQSLPEINAEQQLFGKQRSFRAIHAWRIPVDLFCASCPRLDGTFVACGAVKDKGGGWGVLPIGVNLKILLFVQHFLRVLFVKSVDSGRSAKHFVTMMSIQFLLITVTFFIFFILTLSQSFEAKAYIGYWIRIGLNNYSTVLNCATVFSEGSNIAYCKYLPLLI